MLKPLTWWITAYCGKLLRRREYWTTLLVSWETFIWVKKQQLKLDMEQWTGSKLGKKYIKAIYCHSTYLTYMQSISCKMPGWLNHKMESEYWEKYQQPQICRWYHSNGRTWRGTKQTLEKYERGVKSWLEIQNSETLNHDIQFHHFLA